MQAQSPDYSQRYSESWSKNSADVKRMQSPDGKRVKCACCGKLFDWENTQTHHLFYLKDEQGIPQEVAGNNLVAVCGSKQQPGSCHHTLHNKKYYFHDSVDPVWGNKNSDEVIRQLQGNFVALRQEITGFPSTYHQPFLGQQIPQLVIPENTVVNTPQGQYSSQKIGDIAPGSELSANYRKELSDLALELASSRIKKDKVKIVSASESLTKAVCELIIPLGLVLVILLTILIAM